MSLQERVLIKRLESSMNCRDFWNDSSKIQSYANTILNDFGSLSLVTIKTGSYFSVPECSKEEKNNFLINIPILRDSYEKSNDEKYDIFKRHVFLRHELAHIMYTPFHLFVKHKSETKNIFLYNALEDVRIEYLFGKRFEGSNDAFFIVQNKFFQESIKAISENSPNISMLGLYFLYRSKDFDFSQYSNFSSIKIYDDLYRKYRNFLNEESEELFHICTEIEKEFIEIIKQNKNKKPSIVDEDDSPQDSYDDEDDSPQDSYDDEDDSPQDSYDDEEENDSPQDSYDDEEENDSPIQDSFQNEKLDNDAPSSYEDMIKEMFDGDNNSSEEDEYSDGEKDEIGDIYIPLNKLFSNASDEKAEELLQNLSKEIDSSTNNLKFELSKMRKVSDVEIDLEHIISDRLYDNKKTNMYDFFRKKNKKHIAYIINFLKLKFQKKEICKTFHNKEEGTIENEKLWKILQNKNIDNRIFSKIESAVTSKANVIIVLDFSGSMSGKSIESLLESLVMLVEVMIKLETSFKIFSFTTGNSILFNEIKAKESKAIMRNIKSCVAKNSKNISSSVFYNDDNSKIRAISLSVKQDSNNNNEYRRSKSHYFKLLSNSLSHQKIKNAFNILYDNICISNNRKIKGIFGSGTNEIETMISIYDKYNHIKNTKVFLVNDGIYNDLSSDFYINNFSYVKDSEVYKKIITSRSNLLSLYSYFKIHKRSFYVDNVNIANKICSFINSCVNFRNFISSKEYDNIFMNLKDLFNRNNTDLNVFHTYDEKKGKYEIVSKEHYADSTAALLKMEWHYNGEILKNKNVIITNTDGELTYSDFSKICFFMTNIKNQNNKFSFSIGNIIYKSFIETMKTNGWEIYGIGIYSGAGKEYIGEKNFSHIKDLKDLKDNFSKKLKMAIAI